MAARFSSSAVTIGALALLGALLLSGCASAPNEQDPEETEQQLYERAQSSLRNRNYDRAIEILEVIEEQFPFGRYAEQAQLERVYAHYQRREPERARSVADRFIRLHPQHPNVDYAYYMKGLAAATRQRGLLDYFAAVDPADRDTSFAREAFADFNELVNRFPDSEYAPDARQRMVHLRNLLAESELNVADYYMRRGAYVAAANRARNIVQSYSQTPSAEEALALLVEANWRLGLDGAAQDALRVLAHNFPDHPGFADARTFEFERTVENRDRSWINILSLGLLDRPDTPPPIEIDMRPEEELTLGPDSIRIPLDPSEEEG